MWKILIEQMREERYNSLINRGLFPAEPKECNIWTRDTREVIYSDQNLPTAWIDNKKPFYMVPQRWIIDSLKMYMISGEVKINENTMRN